MQPFSRGLAINDVYTLRVLKQHADPSLKQYAVARYETRLRASVS